MEVLLNIKPTKLNIHHAFFVILLLGSKAKNMQAK